MKPLSFEDIQVGANYRCNALRYEVGPFFQVVEKHEEDETVDVVEVALLINKGKDSVFNVQPAMLKEIY